MATKTIKRIFGISLSLLLIAAIAATPFLSSVDAATLKAAVTGEKTSSMNSKASKNGSGEINGHAYVCENELYRLYMNEEDLSIVVESKENGSYMESSISYDDGKSNNTWLGAMKSALVLTMINKSTDTKQADLVNDAVNKKITYTENGFSADVYWTKYKFGMTLKVALVEDGVIAQIPDESIREDGDAYQIGTISIYPYLGTSYLDTNEGYMFIPDGNGALIYLNNKDGRFASGYSSMIYGGDIGFDESDVTSTLWDKYEMVTDPEQVIAPVFGIAHTDDKIAFLAVVEDGSMRATIEARPNGASVDYNRVYAKFIERKLYTQPTSNNSSSGSFHMAEIDRAHSNLQVRYLFTTGDQANYAGMANAYRDYLLANGTLKKVADTYSTRIDFLGTERKSFLLGTSAVTMTTTEDIEEIYADLKSEEVTELTTVYKGWQKGGLLDLPVKSYKADRKIGGTASLSRLMENAEAAGIKFYLYDDALTINPDEQNATFNVVKKINKRKYEKETYKDVFKKLMYLTPERSDYMVDKLIASAAKDGIKNIALAGITDNMFSWNYSGNFYTRYDCGTNYKATAEKADEKADIIMEQPFAYLWENTEAFLDMPLYTSSYIYEDESIPFLSIVLKGVMPVYSEYVNFEANKQEFFLKLVETGTYPSFYITKASSSELIYTNSSDIYSSQYEVYRNTIISYHNELKALNEKTENAYIIGHELLEGKVTKVTYSNGFTIYINYSDSAVTVDGITLQSMSYKAGE